jgi:hypothetical protein
MSDAWYLTMAVGSSRSMLGDPALAMGCGVATRRAGHHRPSWSVSQRVIDVLDESNCSLVRVRPLSYDRAAQRIWRC